MSFFEKVQADEKKQPGTIPKIFSTHPPTPDRIVKAQNEIATILPAREEYIVTTSEFDTVKRRLQMIEMNMKVDDKKNPNKPSLRKKTDQNPNKGSTGGSDPQSTSSDPTARRSRSSNAAAAAGSERSAVTAWLFSPKNLPALGLIICVCHF